MPSTIATTGNTLGGMGSTTAGGKMIIAIGGALFVGLVMLAALLGQLALLYSSQISPLEGGAGASAVVQAALMLQNRIYGARSNLYDPADPLMQRVIRYWKTYCTDGKGGLCDIAAPGGLQCVQFVSATYWLAGDPLPSTHNGQDFWAAYDRKPGWLRIPSPSSFPDQTFLPPAPGDLMIWKGGGSYDDAGAWREYGHIAVVVSYQPPRGNQTGIVEVAGANAPGNKYADPSKRGNTYRMAVHPDGHIDTWPGYAVLGFLRHLNIPKLAADMSAIANALPAGLTFDTPYVRYAWEAAQRTGVPPGLFVRQIYQESGFHPRAVSLTGAIGIAQFLPSTAAGIPNPLGPGMLDPWEPHQALTASALYMMAKAKAYGSDYIKALAAYNAGDGAVRLAIQEAIRVEGNPRAWRSHLPTETQNYLQAILGQ